LEYQNKFDTKHTWDKVRFAFSKKADALIFYSDYPMKKYIDYGFDPKKLFVAYNSVAVSNTVEDCPELRNDFLFIGTLYKQKNIEILIDAYIDLTNIRADTPKIHIIGGGPMENELRQFIVENKLSDKINIHGPIYDQNVLKEYFSRSIVCISPDQAGLSVLTSMGYGVPYLTSKDAITGGEIFNIEDKTTGLIYEGGKPELIKTLIWIMDNKDKMLEIGRNARNHYNMNRRPEHMADSIIRAVEYALST
jgi:glycosyltransferase involved in cell wall biosynthesis